MGSDQGFCVERTTDSNPRPSPWPGDAILSVETAQPRRAGSTPPVSPPSPSSPPLSGRHSLTRSTIYGICERHEAVEHFVVEDSALVARGDRFVTHDRSCPVSAAFVTVIDQSARPACPGPRRRRRSRRSRWLAPWTSSLFRRALEPAVADAGSSVSPCHPTVRCARSVLRGCHPAATRALGAGGQLGPCPVEWWRMSVSV